MTDEQWRSRPGLYHAILESIYRSLEHAMNFQKTRK